MNQFNIIKIYTIFTQQQDTNSIQVPTNYKPGDTVTYPGTLNKVQKFHGLKESSSFKGTSSVEVYHTDQSNDKISVLPPQRIFILGVTLVIT